MYQPAQELSLQNAVNSAQAGLAAIAKGQIDFDLSALTIVDSSAVAVMLEWQRAAKRLGKVITFHSVPSNVSSLIELYGLSELLTTTASERH
ncbi:MAG: STAS domain-containing protein [Pseudomonadota bacterium]